MSDATQQIAFPLNLSVNLLPKTIELIHDAAEFKVRADGVKLVTAEDRVIAADQLGKIKGLAKELDEKRKEMKAPVDEAAKEIQAYFKPYIDQLATVEAQLKRGMIAFDEEQERVQRALTAKAAEDARKAQETALAKADKLEEKGKVEQADALRENAATIVAAPVAVAAPIKTSGTSTRTIYSAKVTDMTALIKAVADGKLPETVLMPNQKILDGMATALKESFKGMYPGVDLVTEKSLSQRSKSPF